ncbi:MAG: hypothetical protein K2X82_24060 [Gemmataceae bacterium]|nr:hypothetical protein [Gemmataceae bacterium]
MSHARHHGLHEPTARAEPGRLEREYADRLPDVDDSAQLVGFDGNGYSGSPADGTFNEAHVLALTQAVCDYRRRGGIDGPVVVGRDAGELAGLARRTALEVLAANGARAIVQPGDGVVPSPVASWTIVSHNRGGTDHLAEGLVLSTPGDGRFRYLTAHGGAAGPEASRWVEERANEYLLRDNAGVRRLAAGVAFGVAEEDLVRPYVDELREVVDVDAVRAAGVVLGVDPRGGAATRWWDLIAQVHGLEVEAASLPGGRFHLTVATDADVGGLRIATPSGEPLDPDDFLAVAIRYLLRHRPGWPAGSAVGRSTTGSRVIDRVIAAADRSVSQFPPGFGGFADRLFDGSLCFAGEGSRASFLRHDGTTWTTDADGLVLGLLAAEITARTGKDLAELCREVGTEDGE